MKRVFAIIISIIFIALTFSSTGFCDRGIKRITQEKRLALIIGNGAYKSLPLKNPVNDARDMVKSLKSLGFQVIYEENADQRAMKEAIRDFGNSLTRDRGTGLFYFAGHGMQVKGRNYLIPVGARIENESEVEYESVDAGRVLSRMEDAGNRLNIVILDACRDNPFARSFRSSQKGLARMDALKGSLIAYATSPGSVAADGIGRNGVYTKYLLKHMKTSGMIVERVLKNVRIDVIRETGNKQIPWESSSLTGDFYFKPLLADSSGTTVITPPKPKPQPPKDGSLTVNANISGATVWVNGKKYNTAPMTFSISSAGEYAVKVTADGYESYETRKQIDRGADVVVTAYLEKEKTAVSVNQNEIINSLGMKFVYVKPGTFMMGSPASEPGRDNDETQHKVTLTRGFYMQTTEVTQGQWKSVMGSNPSKFKNCGDNCPVEKVSWNDVQDFIKKLNRKESTDKYRLPTEAEWEFAARSRGKQEIYAGGNDIDRVAWYRDNSGKKTHPAGTKAENDLGLYDMSGNVREWCQDWYGNYPSGAVSDPVGPSSGSYRVYRGGCWSGYAQSCRSAFRGWNPPVGRYDYLGFRLLRQP
ncbi:SUMF1/EgtB/PvdO family nonheme iron enzyme [Desulfobacterales bacterium HSG17]|nr:SUMF1/EgtB/PvdO family nonheme iron enzyme [Desulfobacterales bacterium HSG17]